MADLTDRKLRNFTGGKLRADRGLYFIARKGRRPAWEFRFTSPTTGKRRNMILGAYPDVGLGEARERATQCRRQVTDGVDPIEAREAEREAQRRARESAQTLREAAVDYHALMRSTWRNDKHADQWLKSLDHLGELMDQSIASITTVGLLAKLEALNHDRHQTATRVRQRVEAIFERAIVQGRVSQNPARELRRAIRKPATKRNFAALDYRDLPAFLAKLRDCDASQSTRLGFEWLILTAARTYEVRYATWSQIEQDRWAPPGDQASNKQRSACPLTWRMEEVLQAMQVQRGEGWDWIFPSSQRRVKPLSDGAFLQVIDRMGLKGKVTVHGMRASFSTWAYETQPIRGEVVEAALGHTERNAIKAAYSRADYWDARVRLANAWTDYCCAAKK